MFPLFIFSPSFQKVHSLKAKAFIHPAPKQYLEYNINSEDGSNLVKAKSSKVFIMSINYKNKLSNNDYESGIYKENRDIKISLSNNKSNPNTSPNIMIIIIFLLLILAITGITKTKKISLLLITILLIPIYIYAECRYDINISSKILIEGNDPNATEDGPYYNINKDKHYRILNNAFKSARDNQKIIVLEDVEANNTVVGIPAKKVSEK